MDETFTFWYPVRDEVQLDFEKREHVREVLCEGHIDYQGRLMCKESREVLKNKHGAKKEKVAKKREVAPKMCPVCLEAWRNHPESQYYKFTHGAPVKVETREVPVSGAQA